MPLQKCKRCQREAEGGEFYFRDERGVLCRACWFLLKQTEAEDGQAASRHQEMPTH